MSETIRCAWSRRGEAGLCAILLFVASVSSAADWVRANPQVGEPVWGVKGGLVFGIHPGHHRDVGGGPRGLIRITYPILAEGAYDLLNFIAIEPIVRGTRGFSELERSRVDGAPGKILWPSANAGEPKLPLSLEPGELTRLEPNVEQLAVTLRVERFANGAHVYLLVKQRSDRPDEIQLTIHAEPGSAPLDYCILTATMGNKARTRQLWLKDRVINSRDLYPDYRGSGFARHTQFPLDQLLRLPDGDVLVATTNDEDTPAAVYPFPKTRLWYYGGAKTTQYWRRPKDTCRPDLHVAVNARYTYWRSQRPIPGGIAFENFELRERFSDGQQFVFGVTRRTPAELGFGDFRRDDNRP